MRPSWQNRLPVAAIPAWLPARPMRWPDGMTWFGRMTQGAAMDPVCAWIDHGMFVCSPYQNQLTMMLPKFRTAGMLAWLCMGATLMQSCKKDAELLSGGGGPLADERSFSNCNMPVGTTFNVLDFGAIPNDGADDTPAFILAAQAVNQSCNENATTVLLIPSGTYDVGKQLTSGESWTVGTQTFTNTATSGYSYKGVDIISITCCPYVTIMGEGGSRLRFHDNMKYGGDPSCTMMADVGVMVHLRGTMCATVTNLDLDGNNMNCDLLEACNDGYQLAYDGIIAVKSTYLDVSRVHTHHHGRDGIVLAAKEVPGCTYASPTQFIHLTAVNSLHNSRQGLSWVDGQDLVATKCSFSHTGSVFNNNPGAGLDIEPEDAGIAARGVFEKCKFEKNRVYGVVSHEHPNTVWDVKFNECSIWQNNKPSRAIWVTKGNQFTFNKCKIYGTITHGAGASPSGRTRFIGCEITDVGPDGSILPLIQDRLLDVGPGDRYFDYSGCVFFLNHNFLAYIDALNTLPPYQDRTFTNNVFRFNYPALSCSDASLVRTVSCGGSNACNGTRYLAYFRNTHLSGNVFMDSNPLPYSEGNTRNYLIQIGTNTGSPGFENTTDGTNSFQYVPGSNVGHFLRQIDPGNSCVGSRNNF